MGKEKKLFLLAVMTVMMSTAGYSAQIPVGKDENKSNPTEKVLEVGDDTGVDNKGTFTNNGTINVKTDKTTGVFGILNNAGTSTNNGTIKTEKENKGTAIKISGGTVTNSSTGKIELNEGKGIYVAAIKDKNNNYVEAKLENINKIEINNGTGINMQAGTVINESTGEIVINKTNNGIVLGHNNSSFENKGTITIKNGATSAEGHNAIKVSSGELKNSGTIENGDKILIEDGEFTNDNNGTVTNTSTGKVTITGGKFTNNAGGTVNNAGEIIISGGIFNNAGGTVTNSGKVNISGGKLTSDEKGIITNNKNGMIDITSSKEKEVALELKGELKNEEGATINITSSGKNSVGIQQMTSTGAITNNGKINITSSGNDSIGINIKNGIFTNNKDIDITISGGNGNTSGIKQDGTYGKTKNNGTINITASVGAGILVNNGEFENNNKIIVNQGTGIKVTNTNGKFFNTGIIEVNGENAIGIDITNGKLEKTDDNKNNGTIYVNGNKSVGIKTSGNNNQTANNDGNIIVSGESSTGMYASNGGTITNKNNIILGEIPGSASKYSTGIKAYGENASGINEGVITVNGKDNTTSQGMQAEEGGTITNNGKEDKYSAIYVSGSASSGMSAKTNGTAVNDKYGYIEASNKGTGIKVDGKDGKGSTGTNKGSILVTGAGSSKGMSAVNGGTITNDIDGLIQMNGLTDQGAIGIDIQSGSTGTNKGTIKVSAVKYTSAISSAGADSKGINEETGKIIFVGDTKQTSNAMASKDGAEISNKGTIEVSSKNSSGMFATGKGTRAENIKIDGKEETGKISVFDNAVGIKLENNAVGVNSGTIDVQKGIGVTLKEGSLFVNSGTINGVNEAIKSMGGNNTVYLKNGSKITGKIVGADGIDVLGLGTGTYSDLAVNNYEALTVRDGDVKIENSTINLEYNKGTKTYLDEANKNMNKHDNKTENEAVSGNLTMADTTLAINFKDALTNGKENGLENPIINVGKDGTLTFEKGITLVLDSSDGSKKFDIYEALGFGKDENGEDKNGELILGLNGNIDEVFNKTAVWDYYIDSEGHLTAEKESYDNVVSKSQLKDFASLLDKQEIGSTGLGGAITALETLKTQEAFTNAVTQMSGGVHGYIVDFAALNARTLTNTMKNRALTRDYMRKRPLNSWTQDISYIDNNHRLGGLMNVDYTEKGVLGISEKQILPNGRIGLVYGGSKGNAKFENGANGSSSLDGAYFGGYYNHEFNDKWSLNSNANFVYTHNKVTRNVDLTYGEGENKVENPIFKSAYPTYTVGMGTSLIYTVKDDLRNKAHFYAGVDVERIMVGNINENKDSAKDDTGLAIKTTSYSPRTYYSIVPSAGFMVQNTGYVFDRKYRIGADLNWETEVGNIKDGKRLKLTGLDKEYKLETSERENVFSYSLFGALDLTESLSVNARYTSMFSDEYDADMIGAGFEYKMDTMADNFFGTLAHKLENNRPFSDRWGGTFGLIMETDDVDDYTKYDNGHPTSGDVATSMEYKPKMILSLNDKQSNWSYYFEAYHKTNNMFGSIKSDERESHASRYHGEARWNDTYSKGSYGMSFGYRNENSRKSDYYASNKTREIVKNGTHELRITPSFTYDLGHGFTLGGKSAIVFMYKYEGDRAGQMDMNTESQIGFTYTGFMPRWSIIANFYREDTWYDHSYRKMTKVGNDYFDRAPKNDQVNQLRPSIIYYFGNGASFRFDARIPLGNGSWANLNDGTNGNQAYETRYGFNYYYPVTPGLTVNVGGTFLNTKTKNKDHSSDKYGNITRGYAFRPNIGFYYSF